MERIDRALHCHNPCVSPPAYHWLGPRLVVFGAAMTKMTTMMMALVVAWQIPCCRLLLLIVVLIAAATLFLFLPFPPLQTNSPARTDMARRYRSL